MLVVRTHIVFSAFEKMVLTPREMYEILKKCAFGQQKCFFFQKKFLKYEI